MKKILEWQPDESLWGKAKITNVHRIREDLTSLAEWVNTKADAGSLLDKADLARLVDLENRFADIRGQMETFAREMREANETCRQHVDKVSQLAGAGEAAISECLRIEQALREVESGFKDYAARNVSTTSEHAANTARLAEEIRSAAGLSATAKEECVAMNQALRATNDEIKRQLAELLAQAQEQAAEARRNAESTVSAAETAGTLRKECEDLITTVQLKGEELTAACQNAERNAAADSAAAQREDARLTQLEDQVDALTDLVEERVRSAEKEIALFRKSSRSFWKRVKWLLLGSSG